MHAVVMENVSELSVNNVLQLVNKLKENFSQSRSEFIKLKEVCSKESSQTAAGCVIVPVADLKRLQRETRLLRDNLPRVLSPDLLRVHARLEAATRELEDTTAKMKQMEVERDHWQARCEVALAQVQQEKEEKYASQCELRETVEQIAQQSEYCAKMGAATTTLLWRVSRCDESIQAILVGSKVDEFLGVVAVTIESYLETFSDGVPVDESDETEFVLALCGTITNIAASPFGRDFLVKNAAGCHLIDVFLSILSEETTTKCPRMKNLILMALYNISINQKGLKHLCEKPGIIGLLAWQLQEGSEVENRLNSLRLIGSLLCEQTSVKLVHEANEVLTQTMLQRLASDRCHDVRDAALELMTDLRTLNGYEQPHTREL